MHTDLTHALPVAIPTSPGCLKIVFSSKAAKEVRAQ